ncbi:uncharacterized protein LOC121392121 [Gigantopelta aegis]|uniref:uncharacterized protein LOC121392121 n=1 Tax=Gigantopelta aegis TaxID=1735272 RepID=UPI001B88E770|nr:uncharacterized protein LOC121392121 [Gigantopelta aegis]
MAVVHVMMGGIHQHVPPVSVDDGVRLVVTDVVIVENLPVTNRLEFANVKLVGPNRDVHIVIRVSGVRLVITAVVIVDAEGAATGRLVIVRTVFVDTGVSSAISAVAIVHTITVTDRLGSVIGVRLDGLYRNVQTAVMDYGASHVKEDVVIV